MARLWRQHSLTIVLCAVFAVMIIASWPLGRATWSPSDGPYWITWLSETVYSLEADVFGAVLLVVFTKRLREIGSAESK